MDEKNSTPVAYLAGKVLKGTEISLHADWRLEYTDSIRHVADVVFRTPVNPLLDDGRPELIFGHDCYLISTSDFVIVNAETKLGVGTAQEILIAKYFAKPVLAVLPPDSHHRRRHREMYGNIVHDWIDPFLCSSVDMIFGSLGELCDFLALEAGELRDIPAKTLTIIESAVEEYLRWHGAGPLVPGMSWQRWRRARLGADCCGA